MFANKCYRKRKNYDGAHFQSHTAVGNAPLLEIEYRHFVCNTQWKFVGDQFWMKISISVVGFPNLCSAFGILLVVVPGIVSDFETNFSICQARMRRVFQLCGWAHNASNIDIDAQTMAHTFHMGDSVTHMEWLLLDIQMQEKMSGAEFGCSGFRLCWPLLQWFFCSPTIHEFFCSVDIQCGRVWFKKLVAYVHEVLHTRWLICSNACCTHLLYIRQVGARSNVGDMENYAFYNCIQKTYTIHPIMTDVALYVVGDHPCVVWGMLIFCTLFMHTPKYVIAQAAQEECVG